MKPFTPSSFVILAKSMSDLPNPEYHRAGRREEGKEKRGPGTSVRGELT
jgi:hypothetical protein